MSAPFKYAFVLALGLAFGFCIHAPPSLEEVAKLARLDEINVIINKAVARLKPQAAVLAVDPAGATRVTEDLDYRIAVQIRSVGRDGDHSSPFTGAASTRKPRRERSIGFSLLRAGASSVDSLRSPMRRPSKRQRCE